MKTFPILNSAAPSPTSAPKGQQAGSNGVELPFSQMLSHQVSERGNPSETGKPAAKEPAKTGEPGQPQSTVPNARPAEKNKSTEAEPQAETSALAAGDTAAAAQMLALAAQFGQLNAAPPEARPTGAEAALTDVSARDIGVGKNGAADPLLKASLTDHLPRPGPTEKEALLEPAGFDSATEKGQNGKLAPEPASGKLQAALAATIQSSFEQQTARNQEAQPVQSAAALAPLQQAAFDKMQPVAGHATGKLAPPVGATGWDQALGQKMLWMVAGTQQSASLTLNPPDLGPLQVVLNVSSSQATASFFAAQPEVRQALEAALPKLREMLGDAGIQLGQANVSAGTPNQQGSFSEQQHASHRTIIHAGTDDAPPRSTRSTAPAVRQGMVDTFA